MRQFFFLCIFLASCSSNVLISKIKPSQLTCEYLENASVVDVLNPRLAWINVAEPGERGQVQTAYEINVASSKDNLNSPDLWESGKIKSDQSIRVKYDGQPLMSRQECWWQVRVWDVHGNSSEWSDPGFWRMGLLNKNDWKAEWIGAPWQGEEALPKPA